MPDFQSLATAIEKRQIVELLETERRVDGRNKTEFRPIKIQTNIIKTAHGSALVELGGTKVIAGVKAMMGRPYDDYPHKGSFSVGYESNPLAAPEYKLGPPREEAIEVARVTDRVIRESECINLEKLCLIEGEKAWQIFIDIYPLDVNGNLVDAAAIAAFAALSCAKIPEAKVNEEGEVEILETFQAIELQAFPVSVTTFKIGDHFVVDGNLKEELISDARITFGTTDTHIVSAQKGGIEGIKSEKILEILKTSIKVSADLREAIRSQIDIDL